MTMIITCKGVTVLRFCFILELFPFSSKYIFCAWAFNLKTFVKSILEAPVKMMTSSFTGNNTDSDIHLFIFQLQYMQTWEKSQVCKLNLKTFLKTFWTTSENLLHISKMCYFPFKFGLILSYFLENNFGNDNIESWILSHVWYMLH